MNDVKHSLSRIRDGDLKRRIEGLLRELYWASEAPGSSYLALGSSGEKSDAQIPRGVVSNILDRRSEPPRHRFLFEWYVWAFENATSDDERRMLCVQAEIDLGRRHKLRQGDEGRSHADQVALEAEQRRVLIEHGEGIHSADIAAEQGWPVGWVEDTRKRAGRDPVWGRVRPRWRELSDELRAAIALDYYERQVTQRDAAKELGIGQSTLSPYWPSVRRQRLAA